jgi:hypothetical protein
MRPVPAGGRARQPIGPPPRRAPAHSSKLAHPPGDEVCGPIRARPDRRAPSLPRARYSAPPAARCWACGPSVRGRGAPGHARGFRRAAHRGRVAGTRERMSRLCGPPPRVASNRRPRRAACRAHRPSSLPRPRSRRRSRARRSAGCDDRPRRSCRLSRWAHSSARGKLDHCEALRGRSLAGGVPSGSRACPEARAPPSCAAGRSATRSRRAPRRSPSGSGSRSSRGRSPGAHDQEATRSRRPAGP